MKPGEGLLTDMKAVRKDYFLDHDHSAYVDQWDWERVMTSDQRNLEFMTQIIKKIWKVLKGAETQLLELFPQLRSDKYPPMPDELVFMHAEDLLDRFPDLPRKQRETAILKEIPAIFIYGIGWTLQDGYPHEMRAADYDDWVTETKSADGRPMHGLNGDILVWNPVTKRRHELTSMGIRVNPETLKKQLEMTNQLDFLVDRRGHRAVPRVHDAAAQGAPRRGQRHRVAEDPQGHVRKAKHPRPGIGVTGGRGSRQSNRTWSGCPTSPRPVPCLQSWAPGPAFSLRGRGARGR
jgi:AsnA-type aspartate--ammonia ligase